MSLDTSSLSVPGHGHPLLERCQVLLDVVALHEHVYRVPEFTMPVSLRYSTTSFLRPEDLARPAGREEGGHLTL